MRTLRVLLAGTILALSPALLAPQPAAAAPADENGRLVLLLDSSGSMAEPAPGGGTKIDAAKDALRDVVEQLPETADVGMRVFGAKVFSRTDPGACLDTQNVVPVGPLDRDRLEAAVAKYQPYGETPIGNALRGAARDLGPARDGEKRTIVLLSDGEPTCAPDPCQVARQLRDRGIDLRINVVGLDVSGKARDILRCVARAGGGNYFDASNADELSESLVQVSVRGLRLFSLAGTPVTGGTSTAEPTELEPGDYTDSSLADEQPRYYLVDVPEGGSVSASAVMRPSGSERISDVLRVQLLTPDGTVCASDYTQDVNVLGLQSIVGSAAHYVSSVETMGAETCADARQLLVSVDFQGRPSPFGLQIRTYPRVTNLDALPGAVDLQQRDTWQRPVPLTGRGTPVIGSASFQDAPELTPGTTYSDTLRPREQLIYKVPVEWGQSPRMTARLETDPTAARLQNILGLQADIGAFNALGAALVATSNADTGTTSYGRYTGSQPVTLSTGQPPVRYRNAEAPDTEVKESSTAGFYYFTLEMGGDSDRAAERFQAPVRIAVAVDGEPSGEPAYDGEVQGASPSAEPTPAQADASDDDTGDEVNGWAVPGWLVAAVIAVVLVGALGAGIGFLLGRRRRT